MTSTLPLDAAFASAADEVSAQLEAVVEVLAGIPDRLPQVCSGDVARLASLSAKVSAAAAAVRAAVVLEAGSRGEIAGSDNPRVQRWVEQSCRDGDVPVTPGQARQLHDIAVTCQGHDVAALRDAVTSGRVSLESAATVARMFRRLRKAIEYPHWDLLMEALVDCAATGTENRELAALEDALIGQYGTANALDDEHAALYGRRELTHFRRDRAGMLSATLTFDPASEATFSAVIASLSAPHLDRDGNLDGRSAGARRADALLAMVAQATTPNAAVPGSGSSARVFVTIPLQSLIAGLDATDADAPIAGSGRAAGSTCADTMPSRPSPPSPPSPPLTAPVAEQTVESAWTARFNRTQNPASGHEPADAGERGYGCTGYGQILSPTEARVLACDAHIVPAVLGTRGELLDLGRARRLITPALRDALHLRDRGCTFPGCAAPPRYCDGHHIVYWSRGGPSTMSNLALLCRHHHTEVHRHGHTATIDTPGVQWTRGDGSPIGNAPRAVPCF